MTKPGRHLFVQRRDQLDDQAQEREQTRTALDELVEDAMDTDLYSATDGPPPVTR